MGECCICRQDDSHCPKLLEHPHHDQVLSQNELFNGLTVWFLQFFLEKNGHPVAQLHLSRSCLMLGQANQAVFYVGSHSHILSNRIAKIYNIV
jgi:hypothetical protein